MNGRGGSGGSQREGILSGSQKGSWVDKTGRPGWITEGIMSGSKRGVIGGSQWVQCGSLGGPGWITKGIMGESQSGSWIEIRGVPG